MLVEKWIDGKHVDIQYCMWHKKYNPQPCNFQENKK